MWRATVSLTAMWLGHFYFEHTHLCVAESLQDVQLPTEVFVKRGMRKINNNRWNDNMFIWNTLNSQTHTRLNRLTCKLLGKLTRPH